MWRKVKEAPMWLNGSAALQHHGVRQTIRIVKVCATYRQTYIAFALQPPLSTKLGQIMEVMLVAWHSYYDVGLAFLYYILLAADLCFCVGEIADISVAQMRLPFGDFICPTIFRFVTVTTKNSRNKSIIIMNSINMYGL